MSFWVGFEKQAGLSASLFPDKATRKKNREKSKQLSESEGYNDDFSNAEGLAALLGIGGWLAGRGIGIAGERIDKPLNEADAESLVSDLKKSMKTNPTVNVDQAAKAKDAYYSPRTPGPGYVNSTNRQGTIAHEMGHAKHLEKAKNTPLGAKYIKSLPISRQHGGKIGLGLGAALLGAQDETVNNVATALPLVGAAPILFEEGRASASGLRHLMKTRGFRAGLRSGLNLAGAFGTYAAAPVGGALGIHVISKSQKKRLEDKKKKGIEAKKKKNYEREALYGVKMVDNIVRNK